MTRSWWTFLLCVWGGSPLNAAINPPPRTIVRLEWLFKQDPKNPEDSPGARQQVYLVLTGAVNRHVSAGWYTGHCVDARTQIQRTVDGAFMTAMCGNGSGGEQIAVFRTDTGLELKRGEADETNGFGVFKTVAHLALHKDIAVELQPLP